MNHLISWIWSYKKIYIYILKEVKDQVLLGQTGLVGLEKGRLLERTDRNRERGLKSSVRVDRERSCFFGINHLQSAD